jgi:hypothetical protein
MTVHYGDPSLYPVGTYGWPGDYHDPRYPDPIPLKVEKKDKSKKPSTPSEQLPPPRRVGDPPSTAWLQPTG